MKKRTQKRTPSEPLKKYLAKTGMTNAGFAMKIGVSKPAVDDWTKGEDMPFYVGVIVKGLEIQALAHKSIYVYGHPDDVNTIIEIANHFDVETIRLGA